jgi:small GTP-binding protein
LFLLRKRDNGYIQSLSRRRARVTACFGIVISEHGREEPKQLAATYTYVKEFSPYSDGAHRAGFIPSREKPSVSRTVETRWSVSLFEPFMSGIPREKPRFKIIVVGSSGIGKTCLIACFMKKPFDPTGMSTVSPSYMFQDVIRPDGTAVGLQIWDTAGQERYQSVSQLFYRDTNVALVCFESTSDESLEDVSDWESRVRKEVPDCDIILVGTKGDLLEEGQAASVKSKAEDTYTEIQPKGCFITSARTGDGVNELFQRAAELYTPSQGATRQVRRTQDITAKPKSEPSCC